MTVKVSVKPKVEVRARLLVLYDVVRELVEGFTGQDKANILNKGILEQQIIQTISLLYLNDKGTREALITIEIDWEKHQVFAKTKEGETFKIDPERSMCEQIHATLLVMIEHIWRLREYRHVARIRVAYSFLPEIENNPSKLRESRDLLGIVLKQFEWASADEFDSNDVELYKFWVEKPKNLRELTVTVFHPKRVSNK